jgi:hypothetical protein
MSKGRPERQRQLLTEIERLAAVAIFGTLSESYRTCGSRGCHCKTGGPKHGPHLQISYCGPDGKTTGYYVPQAAQEQIRRGVEAWKRMHQLLRDLAELNKEQILKNVGRD